jgi:hypothetical protein
VERVDALVPLKGLAFGLQKIMTVRLEVVAYRPIAETLALPHRDRRLDLPLTALYHLTTIIIDLIGVRGR